MAHAKEDLTQVTGKAGETPEACVPRTGPKRPEPLFQKTVAIVSICLMQLALPGFVLFVYLPKTFSGYGRTIGLVFLALQAVPLGIVIFNSLLEKYHNRQQAQDAERKKLEHEAWLQSTEGKAWQETEHEKRRKQKEEDERRRKEADESTARVKWRLYHESKTMDEISRMSGSQFEEFLARLFSRMGYTDISLTPTNDQGGDLLCRSPNGVCLVIQAKRWNGRVGNSAVQELLGAMLHYDRDEGMVVTNSTFTVAARELAKKNCRITLLDGRWLADQIKKVFPPKTPEFNWEEYNRVVKNYRFYTTGPAKKPKHGRYGRRR
jgi:hypothetical protein